ncbi:MULTISPECIES: SDR family NAD(P)-dependent oxidoreductase [Pseudoxanthomonas]|uniref:Oxidoreductase n=1 Tax=Pseudoxanthomonas winnipegensis TaxID=2480810 RepID=A0AAW8GEL6_9GAMM|nr:MULTISPECIES: SDR family NAD(P)-dependent oxidoreductase [Pseudoxanthomonas]MDQ1120804.1 putative oxidoreductase [Pseudoxanthomonas winnipegensis]MDQ1134029.1 putative oxidoreductase [Pseudoxanthomonas winnipegensis]MDR6139737.1 putative oxidoreductase [Pseudoxanthomonas sp. SORGH_AS_0997]
MTTQRTVLITGGTSGIGLGLARRYAQGGARVVITGRSTERLKQARAALPGCVTIAGDLARADARERLADRIVSELGGLDVLVNNAGLQRRVDIAHDTAAWPERQAEIDLLFCAPIHLGTLLVPLLREARQGGQLVNVTSGGAFNPQTFAPGYSAAKAALHSYTMNLRRALAGTGVTVTELIPPAVATALAGPGRAHGADLDAFCDAVFPRIERGEAEVGFGPTDTAEFRESLSAEHARFEAFARRNG